MAKQTPQALLDTIVGYLKAQDDFLLPLITVWQQTVHDELDFETFLPLIKGDSRFVLLDGSIPHNVLVQELAKTQVAKLPFLTSLGPKVILKKRVLSSSELFQSIAKQLSILHDALYKAYQARNPNDPQTEVRLVELIRRAQQLESQLAAAFTSIAKAS